MLQSEIRNLINALYPELAGGYVTSRRGVVTGIPEAPEHAEGEATDAYRPRLAVNVQLLDVDGQPDESVPELEAVPVPILGGGSESGHYTLPEPGTTVRVCWDYGRADLPYVHSILVEGSDVPRLAPGEQLQAHGGAEMRIAPDGSISRTTPGRLEEQCQTHQLEATTVTRVFYEKNEAVETDSNEEVGGSKTLEVGGLLELAVGSDFKVTAVGQAFLTALAGLSLASAGPVELKTVAGGVYVGNQLTNLVQVLSDLLQLVDDLAEDIKALSYANGGGPTGGATNGTLLMTPHRTSLTAYKALVDAMLA